MTSTKEKVNLVFWLVERKSTIAVQRKFRIECNEEPPHRGTTTKWTKKFQEIGFVDDMPPSGKQCLSEESVASVEDSFTISSR